MNAAEKLEGVAVGVNLKLMQMIVDEEVTVAELLTAAAARIEEYREAQAGSPAGRDFALSITHLEDARSRFNSGVYRMKGTYAPSDAERQVTA